MLTRGAISSHQNRVLDVALASLLKEPESGRLDVLGSELRYELRDLSDDEQRRAIDSCVPQLLRKTATFSGDRYAFTPNGILLVSEPKAVSILEAALSVLKRKFDETKGRGSDLLSWTDIKSELPGFSDDDFPLARHHSLTPSDSVTRLPTSQPTSMPRPTVC